MSQYISRKSLAPNRVGTANNGRAPKLQVVDDEPIETDSHEDDLYVEKNFRLGVDPPHPKNKHRKIKVYEPKVKRAKNLPNDDELTKFEGKFLREEFAELLYAKEESERIIEDASYPEITMIRPYCLLSATKVWQACLTVANMALVKRGDPSQFITLLNGQPISVFYMAALALAHSIFQTATGQIPTLLMNPPVINDLLTAVLPTTRGGIFYEFDIDTPFETLITNLSGNFPYASPVNPLITIAPFTGVDDPQGRAIINNVIPAVTINDIVEVGGEAWETILQWMFGQHYQDLLQRYDSESNYTKNASAFAFFRVVPLAVNALQNVQVASSEVSIPMKDIWIVALQLNDESAWLTREGWNNRTVMLGTHEFGMALAYGHRKGKTARTETPMVNFSTMVAQALIALGAGENILVNATPDGSNNYPGDGPTSIMTTGDFLTALLMTFSRRYNFYSAMYTGSIPPENNVRLIGSGSRFVTTMNTDQCIIAQNVIEDLADMMLNRETSGLVQLPYPMVRGTRVTIDPITPSITNNLVPLYSAVEQWTSQYVDWAFNPAGVNDLPDDINFNAVGFSYTAGANSKQAILNMTSAHQMIQAFMHIGNAVGNDNELCSRNLHITHLFNEDIDQQQGIDITVGQTVEFFSSSVPIDQRKVCNFLQRMFPVFYLDDNKHPAYQAIYKQFISAPVDQIYAKYRLSHTVLFAHRQAGTGYEGAIGELVETVSGEGGNFVEHYRTKDGQWAGIASMLGEGLGSLISPQLGRLGGALFGIGGKAISKMLHTGRPIPILAPVMHGLIDKHEMISLAEVYHSERGVRGKLRQQIAKPPRSKAKKNSLRRKKN